MKKSILMTAFLMTFSSASFAEQQATTSKTTAVKQNIMTVYSRPEILGLWGMEIPDNKKCTEYYNFRGGNEVVVNSAKEWSTGIYDYQPSPDNTGTTLAALNMQITYDNNEADCSKNQQDQSGEIAQFFIKWIDRNTINFCMSDKGEQCLATLRRVLP